MYNVQYFSAIGIISVDLQVMTQRSVNRLVINDANSLMQKKVKKKKIYALICIAN